MASSPVVVVFVVLVASSVHLIQQTNASCNCYDKGHRSAYGMRGNGQYGYGSVSNNNGCVCTYTVQNYGSYRTTKAPGFLANSIFKTLLKETNKKKAKLLELMIGAKEAMIDQYKSKLKALEAANREDKYISNDPKYTYNDPKYTYDDPKYDHKVYSSYNDGY